MSPRVLLVGSGITAAIAAALLRQKCPEKVRVVIWDKARGAGGRMSTSRCPHDNTCIADLGAQYITVLPDNLAKHKDIYSSLLDNGILEPLQVNVEGIKQFLGRTKHFVAPQGMNSLVKHFLNIGADETHFGNHVQSINQHDAKWEVLTQDGRSEIFDIVVLTMPVPQICQLSGSIQDIITNQPTVSKHLANTKYSSRYALALYYDGPVNVAWDVKYLSDSNIFRYVALDNKKRNRCNEPTAIVLHTSIAFGADNVDKSIPDVEKQLLEEVLLMFPELPQPSAVKCQKWRYSQVLEPYEGMPGSLMLSEYPLLLAGGDGFMASGLNGCIESAISLTKQVADFIQKT